MEQPPDSMELKVISCKDLKAFNFFQKLNIYVVVSIVYEEGEDDDNDDSTPSPTNNNNEKKNKKKKKKKQQQQKQKTPIDREGDGNPEWNHLMRFDLKDILSSSSLLLQFDLLSEGTILGDKTIGRVRVPFEDLINQFNGGAVRFVSYQVRTTDGIPNGVLDFSFKPIFNHNPTFFSSSSSNQYHHQSSFVEDNNNNNNFGNTTNGDDVPLIYPPMPSTNNSNYYPPPPPPPPPPLLPVAVDHDDYDGNYINPSSSYYPKIDHFHNPSPPQEIHYPTLEIHSPPSQFHHHHHHHHPLQQQQQQQQQQQHPEVYYHPSQQHPQPQPPSPYHHHHPLPQVAYYPPPGTQPTLFYPPTPRTDHNPYGHGEFGRVGNPNHPVVAYGGGGGYPPNYWASSTQPIHW